jgi:hypothetical protein
MEQATRLTGGCLCGAVRYALSTKPAAEVVCHCKDCQTYTGTAFATVIFVAKNHVQITGELQGYESATDAGNVMTRTFCPNCGTHITENTTGFPDVAVLTAGTLDDPSWIKPTAQCFAGRKQPWAYLTDAIQKFDGMPQMG